MNINFQNDMLYECLEKYAFNVAEHDSIFKAKQQLVRQLVHFRIIIDADKFFEIDRNVISTVEKILDSGYSLSGTNGFIVLFSVVCYYWSIRGHLSPTRFTGENKWWIGQMNISTS